MSGGRGLHYGKGCWLQSGGFLAVLGGLVGVRCVTEGQEGRHKT